MKNFKLKPVNAAIAAAVTIVGVGALMNGTDNPFGQNDLNDGYQNADGRIAKADGSGEGKCGEGKCGGDDKAKTDNAEGKCGEGKCGEDGKAKGDDAEGKCGEGKCGEGHDDDGNHAKADKAEGKCGEGKCGEDGKAKGDKAEGKCGEGKCGGEDKAESTDGQCGS